MCRIKITFVLLLNLIASVAFGGIIEKQTLPGVWLSSGGQDLSVHNNSVVTINLSETSDVKIDLVANVDSFLYLLDINGTLITSDNNSGEGNNARIELNLAAGEYKIIPTTVVSNQSASFILSTSHGSMQYDRLIDIETVTDFSWRYDDLGTDSDIKFSVWRPVTLPGYYRLGDIGIEGRNAPRSAIIVKQKGDLLSQPLDYTRVWGDWGSGGDHDGSFWKPVAQAGYTCLGHLAQNSYNKPSTDEMRCIKSDVLLPATARPVWNDSGSGADYDVGVWTASTSNSKALTAGLFISTGSHSNNGGALYWALNKDRINSIGYGIASDLFTLATTYGPKIWMHHDEEYFASSVPFFMENMYDNGTRLVTNESLGCDDCTAPSFLDGEPLIGGNYTTPSYVITVPKGNGITDLVYFQFYPYNLGKNVCIGIEVFNNCVGSRQLIGNHVGDWEHMTVRLQDGQPTKLYLSQHSDGQTIDWGSTSVAMTNGHPIIYSAYGSHGLYASPGTFTYLSIGNGTDLDDDTSAGIAWDSWESLSIVSWQAIGTYTGDFEWLNYTGDWGNGSSGCGVLEDLSGECILNNGPSGPMLKNATDPSFINLD